MLMDSPHTRDTSPLKSAVSTREGIEDLSEFFNDDPALLKLTEDELCALPPTPSSEYICSFFPGRPSLAGCMSKIERDHQKLLANHEKASQSLLSQLDARESRILQDQKDNRLHSENLQTQETLKLEALHQERLTQLQLDQSNKLKNLQRDQLGKSEQLQKDHAVSERRLMKESLKEGKEDSKTIRKDKTLSSTDKKQKLKIYSERRALILQQRHQLDVFYADQAREIDALIERAELDIENTRVRLYVRLVQVAQIAQLGNNYLQQRQWSEMELSTQTHKIHKERRQCRLKLGTEQLLELSEFERTSLLAIAKLERTEILAHVTETLAQMQKEYDARRAEKIQTKEQELTKLSAELLKFSNDKKAATEEINREQKKQRHKFQGELDTQDTLFKREQARFRESENEKIRASLKQRCFLMQQEQKRRLALLNRQDKEMGIELTQKASQQAASLQQNQVAETAALHQKHLELRKSIEADKLQSILQLKRDQISALQNTMQDHAQASSDMHERHRTEAQSSQLLHNTDYINSLKTLHNTAIEKARSHALHAGRQLKQSQELLWVRWQPTSKIKILEGSTPNAELNDDTLASFLSGTMTPRKRDDPDHGPPISMPISSSSSAPGSAGGIAYIHGRSFEQEIIDKICFDTGLGPDLVSEIIGRIGTVRETEINW